MNAPTRARCSGPKINEILRNPIHYTNTTNRILCALCPDRFLMEAIRRDVDRSERMRMERPDESSTHHMQGITKVTDERAVAASHAASRAP
jgi:hypothetical protein